MSCAPEQVCDVVGIGFGPKNLSLAVALDEFLPKETRNVLILEQRDSAVWHSGMLLPGSNLQTSFLKDLVTVRNPTSPYTFLNYLHCTGRLADFANLRTFYPARVEFSNYLQWVAEHFADWVRYGSKVTSIEPVANEAGTVDALRVVYQNVALGTQHAVITRNLSVAAGHTPRVPAFLAKLKHPDVFHSHFFMHRAPALADREKPHRVTIIGGGQSAVEILMWFMDNRPQDELTLVVSKIGLSPENSSHFINEYFSPPTEDYLFGLADDRRAALLTEFDNTNYGVATAESLEELYGRLYQWKIAGRTVRILNSTRVDDAEDTSDGVKLTVHHKYTGEVQQLQADIIVNCTGYQNVLPPIDMAGLEPYLLRDEQGRFVQARDFRVVAKEGFAPRIHLLGYSPHRFGYTEVTLSILPFKAELVAKSMAEDLVGQAGEPQVVGAGSPGLNR